ncbi:MAG: acyl-CoA thioesterase [Phycisphaerae bacterium]|nr:acyl-CoA thioesterase [Phycisphaerae bacterium]
MRVYEYRHVVGFGETNLLGNVYYTHYLEWQGRCREMFLRDHAPEVLGELSRDLRLVTVRCSCEYFDELWGLDEVLLRMRLAAFVQNRVKMDFEYYRCKDGAEQLVAKGEQEVACMRARGDQMVPAPIPDGFRDALRPYSEA